MKPTDFSKLLSEFLTTYLVAECGSSENTVLSYRDTFVLFIEFMRTNRKIKVEKLTLADITRDAVTDFLNWIENDRGCGVSTRNNRLAAIHSFVQYVQVKNPECLYEFHRVLSIKCKTFVTGEINHLSVEDVKLLLSMPDRSDKGGRRDLALLSFMYDTGARVQEVCDVKVDNVHLGNPNYVTIKGKGSKIRTIPLSTDQAKILESYMNENGLTESVYRPYPLFINNRREKLTRGGITYILKKYLKLAREKEPGAIPKRVSCHSLRHSKAMHLLQAGVNLIYIRDILGHVSIKTTEVYARADSKQKREALEKAYKKVTPEEKPIWEKDKNILDWLKSF